MPTIRRPPAGPTAPPPAAAPSPSTTTVPPSPAPADAAPPPALPSAGGALVDPGAAGGSRVGVAGLSRRDALASAASSAGRFDLAPGRYPQCVALPDVLKRIAASPEGRGAVTALLGKLESETGVKLPPALVSAALANPERVVDALALTTGQLRAGFDALQAAHRRGAIPPTAPKSRQLPKTTDLAKLDALPVKRPEPKLVEIAPGLFHGDVKGDLPEHRARQNIVAAEVLDRLAANATLPAGERFAVRYAGGEYTRVDTFLQALLDDGYAIEVEVRHRIADFAALKVKGDDGRILDVPAAVLVRTGVKDDRGEEAVLPTVHSELVVRLRPSPTTKGERLEADVKWYQGVPQTGFFPCDLNRASTWLGGEVADRWTGAEAARATSLAALLGDVVDKAAEKHGFVAAGYGTTGVCNDSVSIVQEAMTGRATAFPLFMKDAPVVDELRRRAAHRGSRDDPEYRALLDAVAALPSDDGPNATYRERALASIPWASGAEPFPSVERARRILADG